MKNIKLYAPAIGWGLFVFTLSVWPGKDFPQIPKWTDLLSVDKMVHMLFYGILSGLILRGWFLSEKEAGQNVFTKKNKRSIYLFGLTIALFCAVFGWFIEWFQENYCSDRMFEVLDGVANTIGAFVGTFLVIRFAKKG
jgi:VanZ family protein